MSEGVHDIGKYRFLKSETYIVDTNVWFYVYGPFYPNTWESGPYSEALQRAVTAEAKLLIPLFVLTEFIAVCESKARKEAPDRFKNDSAKRFTRDAYFEQIRAEIAGNSRRILRRAMPVSYPIKDGQLASILESYSEEASDFVDLCIMAVCQGIGAKIVTHDADFRNRGVDIITANPALLS